MTRFPLPDTAICLFGAMVLIAVVVLATAIRVVPETKRLSVFRLGRYMGERGPGLVFVLPIVDRAVVIDVHDQAAKLRSQQEVFGAVGKTTTLVHQTGNVEIDGETWNAVSVEPVPPGTKIRVTRVILEVEALSPRESTRAIVK